MVLFKHIGEQIEKGKQAERERQKARDLYHYALAHIPQKVSGTNGHFHDGHAETVTVEKTENGTNSTS